MKRLVALGISIAVLLTGSLFAQCPPGGCCPGGHCPPQFAPQTPQWHPAPQHRPAPGISVDVRAPRPAYRYVAPTGHLKSVVRIRAAENGGEARGSGVVIKVGNKVFVGTAWHVVEAAKEITVRTFDHRRFNAAVIARDERWDCAVLRIEGEGQIDAAELADGTNPGGLLGQKLEVCGMGDDGELTTSTGEAIRFTSPGGTSASDWVVVRGYAMQGDSGGPLFNADGRVVGILWGMNEDGTICATQIGRLNILVSSANGGSTGEKLSYRPLAQLVPVLPPEQCGLKQRREEQQKAAAQQQATLRGIQRSVDAIAANQSQTQVSPVPVTPQPPTTDVTPVPQEPAGPFPTIEKNDDGSAAIRFENFTQAKVLMFIFFAGLLFLLAVGLVLLHKMNGRLLPILEARAKETPSDLDNKLVGAFRHVYDMNELLRQRAIGVVAPATQAVAPTSPAPTAPTASVTSAAPQTTVTP